METPQLPNSIFSQDFKSVYEPAEDTFLLLDALELDLDNIKQTTSVCLECGSGSGTIITALSKALNDTNHNTAGGATKSSRLFIATDINEQACKTTRKCAQYHGQNDIQVIRTNIAQALLDRLENSVDLVLFNPPYVPTDEDETVDSKLLQLAWAGGKDGRKLIDTFLRHYVPRLMRQPNGVAYMVALDRNDIDELKNFLLKEHKINGTIVLKRQAGREFLHVIRYNWII